MNTILENYDQMKYPTDLRMVFDAFEGKQKKFNWLLTNLELHYEPEEILYNNSRTAAWITGEELTRIVYQYKIQFIWGVLSGFKKDITIDLDNLDVEPFADGNRGFWIAAPQIQHPLATVELVCWDSTLTLLLSKDEDLTDKFRRYFVGTEDLDQHNTKYL
ncbi:hypothetical protein [Aneurinibacillus sp. REN35]|uniref:hypothetical protein n=1 Tax=Aneurinibacillus sp. REN35 TaxID=3237286 RepID=UPI003527F265